MLVGDLIDLALALDVNAASLALGNECFQAAGAAFVRNRDVPSIWDANHVSHVSAATDSEIDSLFARMEDEFSGYGHRRFDTDYRTPPRGSSPGC